MEIQTLKCTSCGAPIEVSNSSNIVECPFCHTKQEITRENSMVNSNFLINQPELGGINGILIQVGTEKPNYHRQLLFIIIIFIMVGLCIIFSFIFPFIFINSQLNKFL